MELGKKLVKDFVHGSKTLLEGINMFERPSVNDDNAHDIKRKNKCMA